MIIGLFWFGCAISGNSHGVLDFALSSQPAADGLHVLSVEGEIDLFTAPEIKRAAVEAIEQGATSIVVDLSRTRFLDSTALGVLIGIARRLRPNGGALAIVNTEPTTARTFAIAGVGDIFPIVDTRADALAVLRERTKAPMH